MVLGRTDEEEMPKFEAGIFKIEGDIAFPAEERSIGLHRGNDISEMVEVVVASPEVIDLVIDDQAVLVALLLKADRCRASAARFERR